jgi:hypothetical protein
MPCSGRSQSSRKSAKGRGQIVGGKSPRTRRAYRLDVRYFMLALCISETDQLRSIDHHRVRLEAETLGGVS